MVDTDRYLRSKLSSWKRWFFFLVDSAHSAPSIFRMWLRGRQKKSFYIYMIIRLLLHALSFFRKVTGPFTGLMGRHQGSSSPEKFYPSTMMSTFSKFHSICTIGISTAWRKCISILKNSPFRRFKRAILLLLRRRRQVGIPPRHLSISTSLPPFVCEPSRRWCFNPQDCVPCHFQANGKNLDRRCQAGFSQFF